MSLYIADGIVLSSNSEPFIYTVKRGIWVLM